MTGTVRSVLLLAVLVTAGVPAPPSSEGARLQLAVARGRALVERPAEDGREFPPVTRLASDAPCDLAVPARLTTPALSSVELRWLGHASATLQGAAQGWVEEDQGLVLARFATAEVEVRRGRLRLEVIDLCALEAEKVALGLVSLPDGRVELVHRGGAPVTVRHAGRDRTLRAGERVRLGVPQGVVR